MIQNDFNSGIAAGFAGRVTSSVELFLQEFDLEKAEPIIRELRAANS